MRLWENGQVKACPRCGKLAMSNCWHPETQEVATVFMDPPAALHLLQHSLDATESRASSIRADIETVKRGPR